MTMPSQGRGPSGTVRVKHGRYYPVVRLYVEGARRERWLDGHDTKTAAKAALRKALAAQDQGTWTPPTETMTVGQYLEARWLPSLHLRETTMAGYSRHCKVYAVPQLGGIRLDRLSAADLATFYNSLRKQGARGKPLSENTVARVHATISRALADAVEMGLRATNPAKNLPRGARPKQGRADDKELRYWSAEQLTAFLAVVCEEEPRYYPPLRLAAFSGMRRGEIIGLRWQDVDLDGAHLAVRQTITTADDLERGTGAKIVTGPPKSGKGRRIDLDPETVAVLRSWRLQQAQDRLALGTWPDHGLVFSREDGALVHPGNLSTIFDRLVRVSGLPRLTLHGLRHTHATILVASGVAIKAVSERLGHATIQITLDLYSHVTPGMQAQAVAAFSTAMGGA